MVPVRQRARDQSRMHIFAGALGLALGFGGAQLAVPASSPSNVFATQQSGQALQLTGPAAASTDVQYRNCSAARAVGAAPVRRGDPGYGPHLDRDNNGVGCE